MFDFLGVRMTCFMGRRGAYIKLHILFSLCLICCRKFILFFEHLNNLKWQNSKLAIFRSCGGLKIVIYKVYLSSTRKIWFFYDDKPVPPEKSPRGIFLCFTKKRHSLEELYYLVLGLDHSLCVSRRRDRACSLVGAGAGLGWLVLVFCERKTLLADWFGLAETNKRTDWIMQF